MEITSPNESIQSGTPALVTPPIQVSLADGTPRELGGLDRKQLVQLQWQEEQAFRRRILDAPRGSAERAEAVRQAYDTVTKILAAQDPVGDRPLVMGLHPRYERMLLGLLLRQRKRGPRPSFFEIGYASGVLLERVSQWGFPAAGIEVSAAMHERACRLLGPNHKVELHLGDFLRSELPGHRARYSLIYWNDVFEHVPPDEILDYLRRIHELLLPGGQLVTITPNWHTRPWDVTRAVCPPRTEAAGLHLKEYTLGEVAGLLREAGFVHVATPLVVTRKRALLCGGGLAGLKCLVEPCLELLPIRAVHLLSRGLGLSETIATKGGRTSPAG